MPDAVSDQPLLGRDEVAHLARLARLAVTEEELDTFPSSRDGMLGGSGAREGPR